MRPTALGYGHEDGGVVSVEDRELRGPGRGRYARDQHPEHGQVPQLRRQIERREQRRLAAPAAVPGLEQRARNALVVPGKRRGAIRVAIAVARGRGQQRLVAPVQRVLQRPQRIRRRPRRQHGGNPGGVSAAGQGQKCLRRGSGGSGGQSQSHCHSC